MSIKIEGISKRYDTGLLALDNIHLEIGDHEFVCILGPSGCGKSTLLNIIAGLDKPSDGMIVVDDNQINGPSNDRVMMFQGPSLFPWLTVIENIKFGLKLKKLPKSEQDDIANKFLKLIKLEEFKNYNVHQLSGGMQQRVTLARALAIESPYILMDEPFSSLDKQTINILREELESLWRQFKNTIIYVTHSVEEAIFFADRIVMLSANPGRIKRIFNINLPRPRKIDDEEVVHLRSMILKELRYEVELSEKKKKSFIDIIKMVAVYIAIIVLWQMSYWLLVEQFAIVKAYIFPSPLGTLSSFGRLIENNLLFFALLSSFRKLLIGLLISILLGVILGLLLLKYKFLEKLLKPLILGFQTLPSICFVPFALLWFGLNDTATIFVIVIGSVFSICISVETAIKGVNQIFEKAARTMGANSADVFFKVILPASLPEWISGLKQGWSFAWRALIAGEMVSGTIGGLGYVLLIGRELLDINQIMLVIIILIMISVAIEKLLLGKIENISRKKMGQVA